MGNNKKSIFHRDLPSDDEMPMYRAFREISTSRQTSRDTSRQTSRETSRLSSRYERQLNCVKM